MELHEHCRPLAFLLGVWSGAGEGDYPTIRPFSYLEEVTFGHVGKPFLTYGQKTRDRDSGEPLHAETGYLRAVGPNDVELVIAQPSGIVELHRGTVEGQVLDLELEGILVTGTAKSVVDVERSFRVHQDPDSGRQALVYDLSMAAVGQPMTHHLHAELLHQGAD